MNSDLKIFCRILLLLPSTEVNEGTGDVIQPFLSCLGEVRQTLIPTLRETAHINAADSARRGLQLTMYRVHH